MERSQDWIIYPLCQHAAREEALRLKEGTTLALNYDTGYNTYPLTQPWSILSPIFWTALQACCWHDLTKENRREEKEHVFVSLTSMQGQELFPTVPNSYRVIWRPVVGRIPKCTPCEYRPQIADGGLKTIAPDSNSSCSQLWSILMRVSVNISTHLYMHMHIGPHSPHKRSVATCCDTPDRGQDIYVSGWRAIHPFWMKMSSVWPEPQTAEFRSV